MGSFGRSAGKRISGYFSNHEGENESGVSLENTNKGHGGPSGLERTFTQQVDYETGGPPSEPGSDDDEDDRDTIITRTENNLNDSAFDRRSLMSGKYSRTEARRRNIFGGGNGSAYGYDDVRSPAIEGGQSGISRFNNRANSNITNTHQERDRSNLTANPNRQSYFSNNPYAPDFEEIGNQAQPPLSFAQRFLLANDDAVLSLTDLWVAAAINGEDTYEGLDEDVFLDDEDQEYDENDADADDRRNSISVDNSTDDEDQDQLLGESRSSIDEESSLIQRNQHLVPLNFAKRKLSRGGNSEGGSSSGRPRFGRKVSGGRTPSLYNNTGVERPISPSPSNINNQGLLSPNPPVASGPGGYDPTLAGIPESHSARNSFYGTTKTLPSKDLSLQNQVIPESGSSTVILPSTPTPSIFSLLPLVIIAQYGLMSLHSSTFEQVFMAFLVTPYTSGGLGLSSQHYAELIAAMAVCQLIFQFWFYPTVGPPRGRFSHLAMMRIGLALYLPAYSLFPYLRNFLHPDNDARVMMAMTVFAGFRWACNVTAFTAVTGELMKEIQKKGKEKDKESPSDRLLTFSLFRPSSFHSVLMNAMTPPHLVPLANGLAQTTSSAARFIGELKNSFDFPFPISLPPTFY